MQKPRAIHIELPQTGLLRIKQVLMFIPISRSCWWQGVRDGRFPKPIKLGPRTTVWRVEEIRTLFEREEANRD
jgi:predicted DNA-binding transcriptional regulator AlpA